MGKLSTVMPWNVSWRISDALALAEQRNVRGITRTGGGVRQSGGHEVASRNPSNCYSTPAGTQGPYIKSSSEISASASTAYSSRSRTRDLIRGGHKHRRPLRHFEVRISPTRFPTSLVPGWSVSLECQHRPHEVVALWRSLVRVHELVLYRRHVARFLISLHFQETFERYESEFGR